MQNRALFCPKFHVFVEMGGKAVIVDINAETAAQTCKELGNAVYYTVDLSDGDEVVRVFEQIAAEQVISFIKESVFRFS